MAGQIDMVRALTKEKHGFAFAWNNGIHGGAGEPQAKIGLWYLSHLFALNQSYPAFSNSSIDDDLGNGDPAVGDLEGGINLGFEWNVDADEADR